MGVEQCNDITIVNNTFLECLVDIAINQVNNIHIINNITKEHIDDSFLEFSVSASYNIDSMDVFFENNSIEGRLSYYFSCNYCTIANNNYSNAPINMTYCLYTNIENNNIYKSNSTGIGINLGESQFDHIEKNYITGFQCGVCISIS